MLNAYKFSDGFIQPCPPDESPDWLDLAAPTEAELDFVRRRYSLSEWFFTDSLDARERPRVDQEGDTLFFIIRLSIKNKGEGGPLFTTVPVGLILTENLVISICAQPLLLAAHVRPIRRRNWSHTRLIFAIFHAAGTGFIESLEAMEEEAGQSEARLRKAARQEEILAILAIEKSLIHITTALKSNHALMEKFTRVDHPVCLKLCDEERDLLDDAMTENQQAIFMADIFSQVLASISDAFGSIISNNLNKIMKFLAGVTIVLTIPMIVAGFYGMNVGLPGAGLGFVFWLICAFTLGAMLGVSILFAKKNWF